MTVEVDTLLDRHSLRPLSVAVAVAVPIQLQRSSHPSSSCCCGKSTQPTRNVHCHGGRSVKRSRPTMSFGLLLVLCFVCRRHVAKGSSFPGTIKSTSSSSSSSSSSDSWWNPSPPNSDDELSSSDYDWAADEAEAEASEENEDDDEEEVAEGAAIEEEVGGELPDEEMAEASATTTPATTKMRVDIDDAASANSVPNRHGDGLEAQHHPKQHPPTTLPKKASNSSKRSATSTSSKPTKINNSASSTMSSRPSSGTSTTSTKKKQAAAAATSKASNKPLKTLEKLQQMLDETDYMTSRRGAAGGASSSSPQGMPHASRRGGNQQEGVPPQPTLPKPLPTATVSKASVEETSASLDESDWEQDVEAGVDSELEFDPSMVGMQTENDDRGRDDDDDQAEEDDTQIVLSQDGQQQLWTSKDRSKYKKQQQILRRKEEDQNSYFNDPHRLREYQQQRVYEQHQRMQLEQQQRQQQQQREVNNHHLHHVSSDAEDQSDTDDGLGYTLPNLPIYFSDAEGDSDADDSVLGGGGSGEEGGGETPSRAQVGGSNARFSSAQEGLSSSKLPDGTSSTTGTATSLVTQQQQPQQPFQQQPPGWYPPQYTQQPPMQGNYGNTYYPPYGMHPPPNPSAAAGGGGGQYPYPYPPSPYYYSSPQYQQQLYAAYANAWRNSAMYGGAPYPQPYPPPQQQQQPFMPTAPLQNPGTTVPRNPKQPNPAAATPPRSFQQQQQQQQQPSAIMSQGPPLSQQHNAYPFSFYGAPIETVVQQPETLAEAISTRLSFVSLQKLATCLVLGALLCYSAVSPRNLSLVEHNQKFHENMRIAYLAIIPPLLLFLFVLEPKENNVNQLVSCFYNSFTIGYVLAFAIEILATTLVRLVAFCIWEPNIFQLSPKVPIPIIPWVLRDHKYRPKRITLFAADLATSCVLSPLVEEYLKLVLLQCTVRLPKNFEWVTKKFKNNKKKKVAEPIPRTNPNDKEVIKVNSYVVNMLAISVGLKLADAVRRICMYTKATDMDKSFYAFVRGIFPIHELCGTVTALSLARRDVLGQPMPMWKLLLPSVIFHGMANFRGMKPIFKWNSATPWSEMQLSPTLGPPGSTLGQLAAKAFPKVMWLIIQFRVLGYCIKNYYLINRHAVKRTTTFAGKHAAFSAALEAAESLKKTKKSKDGK